MRDLRNRLALTTILSVVPFLGYGREAFAACDPAPASPTFVCGGTNVVTLAITADNADVSTTAGFSVIAPAGNGITITGDGHLRFTDDNASIIAGDEDGLSLYAAGDAGATRGALTVTVNSTITGGSNGIRADNNGTGDIVVTADGKVTGGQGTGILAGGGASGRNLSVNTGAQSDVTGYRFGIDARNSGTGDLNITANGKVTALDGEGIFAFSTGRDLTITTGADSDITGNSFGIRGRNDGVGDLTITTHGDVTGTVREGVYALAASATANNLTVTVAAGSTVNGGYDGVEARSLGHGALTVAVYGEVTGAVQNGVWVVNYAGSSATVTTGAQSKVTGYDGIGGRNDKGDFIIAVDGEVTGRNRYGIYARNSATADNMTITTGARNVITGRDDAINAQSRGTGDLMITANGEVTGTVGNGISAVNYSTASRLTVTTGAGSAVTGFNGIAVRNDGDGDTSITVDGVATGRNGRGISAINYGAGDTITTIKVDASGVVQGLTGGVYANSDDQQGIFITNAGLVTATNWLAIDTIGGATEIGNTGTIFGRVDLTDEGDIFNNLAGGVFEARGASFFGGGADVLNNAGTLHAAGGLAAIENVYFEDLETLNNSGTISLVDGLEGDQLGMGPATQYVGYGGRLAVDAFLAPGAAGKSDLLIIFGDTSGTTSLVVNLTNPIGSTPNYAGIPVVSVTGSTSEEDFKIEGGVLNAGFFAWDLQLDGNTHELVTTGLGAGAYEFAAGITGAQDIWQQTTGTLLQRQADLRPIIAAQQVTPVADFVTPVEPTPVGRVTPGLWFKAVGGWLDRDGDADNNVVLDRKQTVFGGIAGFDFGTENLSAPGDALLFGLFGGYLTSKLDFSSTNTEWKYDGPTIGAYATYLSGAFYADAIVKADFLDIDIDADDLAPGAQADTNAFNIGGQIDLGYKIGFGQGAFIEPQASLAVLHTEIDDVDDIFGGSAEFEDATSARGRLGLRLGADYEHNGLLLTPDVTASLWQSFTGDNNVTVFAPLTPGADVSDDPGETVGDVSLGFAVTAPDGWSGFLRGNYQFAEDFEAVTGNAGVRYSW